MRQIGCEATRRNGVLVGFVVLCVLARERCAAVTLESPCPSVLKYLPLEAVDAGAWTAEVHLSPEDDLQGVWLHVVLDKKANSLLNWFGESTTLDNREYAIRKPEYKLPAGPSIVVKMRVNYNAADAPPVVRRLRLNGRTICAIDKDARTTAAPASFVPGEFGATTERAREVTRTTWETRTSKPTTLRVTRRPSVKDSKNPRGAGDAEAGGEVSDEGAGAAGTTEGEKGQIGSEEFFPGDLAHLLYPTNAGKRKNLARGGPRLVPDQDVQCGVPVKRAVPLITFGRPSIEGAWPWHIAIYTLDKYTCGGSLLTPSHVLTAAHCVARPRTALAAAADGFRVHLGRTQLSRFSRGLQQRRVGRILVHPRYNHTNYRNDLAIVTLDAPAEYTDHVRPVCLTTDTLARDLTRELGTVVGWGFDQRNNVTDLLHETRMPVVDLLTCIYSEPEVYGKLTSTNNFCAGFRNGTSVCNGDSGGGMFFERDVGGAARWEIRGMVSFSVASRNDLCNPNAYAVFTDVMKFKGWIMENIREEVD